MDKIYCLRENGVVADSRESIRSNTTTLATASIAAPTSDIHPFADIEVEQGKLDEDEEELEENKVVLKDCLS